MGKIGDWLTGRKGVYRDSDKVEQARNDLKSIKTNEISAAKDAIADAVNSLNACTGLSKYVIEHIDSTVFDETIDYASIAIDEVVNQIDAKEQDIKDYDSASTLEKIGATAGMVFCKLGEGFVGAFEGIGDAVLTAGAWVCKGVDTVANALGADWHSSEKVQDWIKYDVAHSMFEWYYDSDLAKKSAFTEDSGLASITRGVGQAVGYMTMAGYVSGACKALNAAGKLGTAASTFASTTNANALIAGVAGLGEGTERGLQQGYGLGASTLMGVKEGSIQALMAYGAGKIGEAQAVKAMEASGMTHADAVSAARAMGGYYDGITTAAQARGLSDMNNIIANTAGKTGIHAVTGFSKAVLQNGVSLVRDTASTALGAAGRVAGVAIHPIRTVRAVAGAIFHPVNTAKAIGNAALGAAKYAAATPGTTAFTAMNALKDPVGDGIKALNIPGVSSDFGLGLNENRAAEQFKTSNDVKENVDQKFRQATDPGGETASEQFTEQKTEGGTEKGTEQGTQGDDYYDDTTHHHHDDDTQKTEQPTEQPTEEIPTEKVTEQPTEKVTEQPTEQTTQQHTEQTTQQHTEQPTSGGGGETVIIQPGGGETTHSGGGYTAEGGYESDSSFTDDETGDLLPLDEAIDGISSIDEIIKGGKYTKIPTTSEPIKTSSGGSSVIPIAAGLSAAAAAGIGAKAYMDHKRNSENDDEDEDDDWSDEDSIDISYDDANESGEYLSDEDDYGYQDQKYGARSNDELANTQ